jgi:hypothetical protein
MPSTVGCPQGFVGSRLLGQPHSLQNMPARQRSSIGPTLGLGDSRKDGASRLIFPNPLTSGAIVKGLLSEEGEDGFGLGHAMLPHEGHIDIWARGCLG